MTHEGWGSLRHVIAKVWDCDLEVSEFEIQLHYYVHLRTHTLSKGINPFNSPTRG